VALFDRGWGDTLSIQVARWNDPLVALAVHRRSLDSAAILAGATRYRISTSAGPLRGGADASPLRPQLPPELLDGENLFFGFPIGGAQGPGEVAKGRICGRVLPGRMLCRAYGLQGEAVELCLSHDRVEEAAFQRWRGELGLRAQGEERAGEWVGQVGMDRIVAFRQPELLAVVAGPVPLESLRPLLLDLLALQRMMK
jgi:hypothetical protein